MIRSLRSQAGLPTRRRFGQAGLPTRLGFGQAGQTLVEVAVGMALLSVLVGSAVPAAVSSSRIGTISGDQLKATQLAKEGVEAMRSVRDRWMVTYASSKCTGNPGNCGARASSWTGTFPSNTLAAGSLTQTGTNPKIWNYVPTPNKEQFDANGTPASGSAVHFTRRIWVTSVESAVGSDTYTYPSSAPGDPKRVTVVVSWADQNGQTQSVSADTVLSDYGGL